MIKVRFGVVKTPGGNHKVYAIGQPNGHITDWSGCNFHFSPLPKQPRRGTDVQSAFDYLDKILSERERWEEWARNINGSFFSDYGAYTEVYMRPKAPKRPTEQTYTVTVFDVITGERLARPNDEVAQSFDVRATTSQAAAFKAAAKVGEYDADVHVFDNVRQTSLDYAVRTSRVS